MLAFDRTTRPVLGFRESIDLVRLSGRQWHRARIDGLEPTWGATDLGQALIDAVAAIEDVADSSERSGRMPRRIVLVSDLQQGSRLEALGEFEWPSDVELEIKTVADDSPNAGLQRLAEPAEAATAGPDRRAPRPRLQRRRIAPRAVRPAMDGSRRRRRRRPGGRVRPARREPGRAHAPRQGQRRRSGPSSSRATSRPSTTRSYVLDEPREEATVLFIGDDKPDDPDGLLFYLMRVFIDTPRRTVKVVAQPPSAAVSSIRRTRPRW